MRHAPVPTTFKDSQYVQAYVLREIDSLAHMTISEPFIKYRCSEITPATMSILKLYGYKVSKTPKYYLITW